MFSVFLLHELDLTARKSIFFEINRVTRPGGFIGAVDSLQLGETPELDSLLLKSPKFFQGPTYGNYLESPLESHLTELGLQQIRKTRGFLAKACWGRKPDNGVLETATALKLS